MAIKVDEKELIVRLSEGDRAAFSLLYKQYLDNICRYIFSICHDKQLSEEITQDLFIKIWENRAMLATVTLIKPYLYRSARNLLLNHIRKEQLQSRVIASYQDMTPVSVTTIHEKIAYDQYFEITRNAVDLLPEKRKQIFKLRSDEALTIDEIAARLSISRSVVKKQWHKGVMFVREYLHKHGEMTIIILSLLTMKYAQ
jgi:RNA polymerase sigma-70 factor (ECF subfamily)